MRLFRNVIGRTLLLMGLALALTITYSTVSIASSTTAPPSHPHVGVSKLPLLGSVPRVVIDATEPVEVLFSQPGEQPSVDRLVPFGAGSTVHELPWIVLGGMARWYVTVYDPETGNEVASKLYTWQNYRQSTRLSRLDVQRSKDVYVEVKGRAAEVRRLSVRTVSQSGVVRMRPMVLALTDAPRSTRVYVRTLVPRERATAIRGVIANGRLANASVNVVR